MINELYQKTLDKYSEKFSKEDIDFIGLNISQNGDIEFKIYPIPDDNIYKDSAKSSVEKFLLHNNLCRCKCFAYSLFGERSYVAIKDKSKENIEKLFEELSNHHSYINKNIDEIKKISLMKVSDDSEHCFSSLHMIGEKSMKKDNNILNVEWITRKMSDPNNPGFDYKYDNMYYLNYLDSLNIKSFSCLCDFVRNYLLNDIVNGKLHVWLVAVDYILNEKKKYKIYFKCDSEYKFPLDHIILNIVSDKKELPNQINEFLNIHNELSVYGFAIGIDFDNSISLNCYLIDDK